MMGPVRYNRALRGGTRMADRNVHYEAAFEAYLRQRAIPYVAVDEAKRALFANAKLKGFDFVVYSKNGPNLLIDIKGRQCNNARNGGGGAAVASDLGDGEGRAGPDGMGAGLWRGLQGRADVLLLDRRAA